MSIPLKIKAVPENNTQLLQMATGVISFWNSFSNQN